jgi:hypothetical protein
LWAKKLACFPVKAFPAVQAISLSLRLGGLCVRTVFLPHATAQRRNEKGVRVFSACRRKYAASQTPQPLRGGDRDSAKAPLHFRIFLKIA